MLYVQINILFVAISSRDINVFCTGLNLLSGIYINDINGLVFVEIESGSTIQVSLSFNPKVVLIFNLVYLLTLKWF